MKTLKYLILLLLVGLSFSSLTHFIKIRLGDVPFVDEVNFIEASRNFILHGNYSISGADKFSPNISAGFLVNFPSGFASALGLSFHQIRVTSYLYSLFLIALTVLLALTFAPSLQGRFSALEKWAWVLIVPGLLIREMPYAEGSFMTLGEFPSFCYLGMGLALLKRFPATGFALLGASVFGGKMVQIAFCGPLLIFYIYSHWEKAKKWSRNFWPLIPFFFYPFLWVSIIVFSLGAKFAGRWIQSFFTMLYSYGTLASGVSEVKVPFFQRWSNPRLEWVHYPRLMRLKVIALLSVPALYVGIKGGPTGVLNRIQKEPVLSALIIGEGVFTIWYFCFHPMMWIRHVQPALAMGFGFLFWLGALGMTGRYKSLVQPLVLCFCLYALVTGLTL